jgi:hypothetical protein
MNMVVFVVELGDADGGGVRHALSVGASRASPSGGRGGGVVMRPGWHIVEVEMCWWC